MESYDETGSVKKSAAYPRYATESSRLKTYENWPKQIQQKPEQLADAGLFYTQKGDEVICFSCGGGLRAWEQNDIPWEQHALYYDTCKYVKLLKGDSYHDEVITKLARARIEKETGHLKEDHLSGGDKSTTTTAITDDEKCCTKFEEKLSEYKKCKICYNNEYDTIFLPCAHIIACAKCASSLATCPMCNGPFEKIVKVFFP